MPSKTAKPFTGKKLFWIIFAFFAVCSVVNGVMIYLGATSWNGVVEENHYEKGINYNERLNQAKQQQKLGWDIKLNYQQVKENNEVVIELYISKDSIFLEGLNITATAVRPTHEGFDKNIIFSEKSNMYASKVKLPLKGQWEIVIQATKGNDSFVAKHWITIE